MPIFARNARHTVVGLVQTLAPFADEYHADAALAHVDEVFTYGNSADRQRRLVAGGGTLLDVVRHLADELVPAATRPT